MATSQQQWRHGSQLLVVVASLALVLFVGGAHAWGGCPAGFKDCDPYKSGCETCIDKDVNNCGGCGNKCKDVAYAVAQCSGGYCKYTCKAGWANCDGDWGNGCEVNTGNDAHNCGSCGNRCKDVPYAVAQCSGGYCKYTCKAGWANCDGDWGNGCEVNTGNDAHNCGSCGNRCKDVPYAVAQCSGGYCKYTCKAGWGNCDGDWSNGCEKDLTKDVYNCGKCGNKCPCSLKGGEPTCSNSQCGQQCKNGSKYDSAKKCCVPKY